MIDQLPARAPAEALSALARSHAWVTLRIAFGHTVDGRVLAVGDARRRGGALVAGRDGEVTYVDVASIVAITVHDAARHAAALSDGKLTPPLATPAGAGPPPTRLELKRKVASPEVAAVNLDVTWASMPEAGEELRVLASVIDEVTSALAGIRGDELGQQALAGLKVVVENGPSENVVKNATTLVITVPLARGGMRGVREAIERSL